MKPQPLHALPSLIMPATCLGLLLCGALAAAPASGNVGGVVPLPARKPGKIAVEKYTGTISGKVAIAPPPQAGVWLEGPGTRAEPAPATTSLPQAGYQFSQSLLIVPVGTKVEFPNLDNDYHNIVSLSPAKPFDIGRYKKDERPVPFRIFDKPGLVSLRCDIHDHMSAAILVVDSRWRALTDSTGRFSIKGVPAGTYTLHAQLDKDRRWSVPIVISVGKTTTASFQLPQQVP